MHLHHAVAIEGERSIARDLAHRYIEETLQITYRANPDVSYDECDQFTIDDARALAERAAQSALTGRQVFIVAFDRITREAQHALLKLLEEPQSDTHFILLVPSAELLLATIRSRIALHERAIGVPEEHAFARTFLDATIDERIKMLEPLYKNVKDDMKQVVRTRARRILDALEATLRDGGVQKNAPALREIMFVRGYSADPSCSLKMLLEHLAVTL